MHSLEETLRYLELAVLNVKIPTCLRLLLDKEPKTRCSQGSGFFHGCWGIRQSRHDTQHTHTDPP